MTKKRLNLRNVVAIAVCLAVATMFSGCDKDEQKNSLTHDEGVVINGVKWATRNVGATGTFATTPESTGMYYQWGRKTGFTVDTLTSPPTLSDPNAFHLSWNGGYETPSESDVWKEENCPCPKGWRVPTKDELQKLIDAGNIWTSVKGVTGRRFGDGNNSVFLPAVGAYIGDGYGLIRVGQQGIYSSNMAYDFTCSYSLSFWQDDTRTLIGGSSFGVEQPDLFVVWQNDLNLQIRVFSDTF